VGSFSQRTDTFLNFTPTLFYTKPHYWAAINLLLNDASDLDSTNKEGDENSSGHDADRERSCAGATHGKFKRTGRAWKGKAQREMCAARWGKARMSIGGIEHVTVGAERER
jgi:hypothetical protein